MKKRSVKTFMKALRIALAVALLGAFVSFAFAWIENAPFFLSLTALFLISSLFFGFNLLLLSIFWD